MTKILVTGSTGQLGRPTAAALREAGHEVRGMNRSGGPDTVGGDLLTGRGLEAALDGVDTVVHLATTGKRRDLAMAENLTSAARHAGVAHCVLISIVGIDRIPLGFYRDRLAIEEIALASGVPLTIQRATQFHSLIDTIFSVQKLPVVFAPKWTYQPIAVEEVAARLAELAAGGPIGRAEDIGGPAQLSMRELYDAWKRATGTRRPAAIFRLPGKLFAAYDAGASLVPGTPYGRETFESYLAGKYS